MSYLVKAFQIIKSSFRFLPCCGSMIRPVIPSIQKWKTIGKLGKVEEQKDRQQTHDDLQELLTYVTMVGEKHDTLNALVKKSKASATKSEFLKCIIAFDEKNVQVNEGIANTIAQQTNPKIIDIITEAQKSMEQQDQEITNALFPLIPCKDGVPKAKT